jgi:hypothetical protein
MRKLRNGHICRMQFSAGDSRRVAGSRSDWRCSLRTTKVSNDKDNEYVDQATSKLLSSSIRLTRSLLARYLLSNCLLFSAIALGLTAIVLVTAGIRAVRPTMGSFESRKLSVRIVDRWPLGSFGPACITLTSLGQKNHCGHASLYPGLGDIALFQ